MGGGKRMHRDKTADEAIGNVAADDLYAYKMQRRALWRDWIHLGPEERKRRSRALDDAARRAGIVVGTDLPDGAA